MTVQEITSLKDEKIQLAKSLTSQKERIKSRKFLVEGIEAISWAIDTGIIIDFVLVSRQLKDHFANQPGLAVFLVSDGLLKKVTDTNYLIPVVAVGNVKESFRPVDFLLVLDDLKDFGNIGTIIRTAHAFGIETLLSTKADFDLFQRKTVDASRGKAFSTQLKAFQNPVETIEYLKAHDYQIVTTSPYGNKIQSLVELSGKQVALVVGNETNGVSEEFIQHADVIVQIPMQSEIESLNVGVATGISIYELKLKQIIGMIEKKIKSNIGRDVNVAGALIYEALDKELKKVSDLSSKQLVFVMVLKCDTIMSLLDAQKQFGIPDQEIKPFFDPLLSKGFIRFDASGNLTITETGIEAIGKLWTVIENTEKLILKDFTDDEKSELKRLLDKLKNNCIRVIDKGVDNV